MKVCCYLRVSTDKDEQINSIYNQKNFFENEVKNNNWELIDFYIDEGVSGTSVKNRKAFNKMILDAQIGKFDLIITKEVSRFARNTIDTLKYTRFLKEKGIGIYFLNDNINTLDNEGEFRLTIMASVAQEESRKISERVKFGQDVSMKKGVVFGSNVFGYNLNHGVLTINKSEADIVKQIYFKFLNEDKSYSLIAKELNEKGVLTKFGKKWHSATVFKILKNEKYCGDLIQKKYITIDYLNHKKIENKFNENKIFFEKHHTPILDKKIWIETQEKMKKISLLKAKSRKKSSKYWFSSKIICDSCKKTYNVRYIKSKDQNKQYLKCYSAIKYGRKYCLSSNILVENLECFLICFIKKFVNIDALLDIYCNDKKKIDFLYLHKQILENVIDEIVILNNCLLKIKFKEIFKYFLIKKD